MLGWCVCAVFQSNETIGCSRLSFFFFVDAFFLGVILISTTFFQHVIWLNLVVGYMCVFLLLLLLLVYRAIVSRFCSRSKGFCSTIFSPLSSGEERMKSINKNFVLKHDDACCTMKMFQTATAVTPNNVSWQRIQKSDVSKAFEL